jgi:hypothetical protein
VLEILAKADGTLTHASSRGESSASHWVAWTTVEPASTVFTFWGRKHTAHVVGDTSRANTRRIHEIIDESQTPYRRVLLGDNDRCRHSFGGAAVLSGEHIVERKYLRFRGRS